MFGSLNVSTIQEMRKPYQRSSDGRWIGSVPLKGGGRRYVTGTNEEKVKARLRALENTSTSRRPSGETVATFLTRWLDDEAWTRLRPRTMASYRTVMELHVVPYIGSIRVVSLEAPDVQRMVMAVLKSGRSPQTAKHALKVLRGGLAQAVRWGMVERNVASFVKSPTVTRKPLHPLTLEESRTFLASVREHPHYALYVLALTTGMRRGELLGLRWPDVNLVRGTLTVRTTLRQTGPRDFWWDDPKTERSKRTLPLSQMARDALTRHKVGAYSASVVFARPDGRPLPGAEVTREFQALLTVAKLPKQRFHDLRHTAASLMLEQSGGDLRQVMAMLGHSTITTTVDIYGGIADAAKEHAAEGMDRAFNPENADKSTDKANGRA